MFQGFGPKLVPSCKPLGEKLFLTKKTYLAFKLVSSWSHGTLRNAKKPGKTRTQSNIKWSHERQELPKTCQTRTQSQGGQTAKGGWAAVIPPRGSSIKLKRQGSLFMENSIFDVLYFQHFENKNSSQISKYKSSEIRKSQNWKIHKSDNPKL